jgi:hypothetical protein
VIDPAPLTPQRHEPPAGWSQDVFARVTEALAAALVASWRRDQHEKENVK